MTAKKIKVLTIGDNPLFPSGVGTQSKYMIEALLDSGKFEVISFAGAMKHNDYKPIRTDKYKEEWTIFPVDGYGDPDRLRSILRFEKPDILWFMTDPRFYEWLWAMEDEIRPLVPMVYYHVWDNYPMPTFNKDYYDSNDLVASISKVTSDIVQNVSPEVTEKYIPHSVDTSVFCKLSDSSDEIKQIVSNNPDIKDKFVCFWNNRNARRKQSGTLVYWFKEFLDKVGHENATMIMHTDVNDQQGQPLDQLIHELGIVDGQIQFSTEKLSPEDLNIMYNLADVTINIADAEGFGLATMESLAAETPILVTMTGGLQEQVTDGESFFGVGIEPASKTVIGSPRVPFIHEDRINKDDFLNGLTKLYEMKAEERQSLGKAGRKHVVTNYNFENFKNTWVKTLEEVHEKHGSWETRKGYNNWELIKL